MFIIYEKITINEIQFLSFFLKPFFFLKAILKELLKPRTRGFNSSFQ